MFGISLTFKIMPNTERKRIAVEIPVRIHKKVKKYCDERGYSMTQWILQLIINALEKV